MTDWEQAGDDLRKHWLTMLDGARRSAARVNDQISRTMPMLAAVQAHNRGDSQTITQLLRSDTELSQDDRDCLAQFLDGGFDPDRSPGAPKGNDRWVASVARKFRNEWRALIEARGGRWHGLTAQMNDASVRFIVEAYVPTGIEIDEVNVGEIMRRGKDRQN